MAFGMGGIGMGGSTGGNRVCRGEMGDTTRSTRGTNNSGSGSGRLDSNNQCSAGNRGCSSMHRWLERHATAAVQAAIVAQPKVATGTRPEGQVGAGKIGQAQTMTIIPTGTTISTGGEIMFSKRNNRERDRQQRCSSYTWFWSNQHNRHKAGWQRWVYG